MTTAPFRYFCAVVGVTAALSGCGEHNDELLDPIIADVLSHKVSTVSNLSIRCEILIPFAVSPEALIAAPESASHIEVSGETRTSLVRALRSAALTKGAVKGDVRRALLFKDADGNILHSIFFGCKKFFVRRQGFLDETPIAIGESLEEWAHAVSYSAQ